MEDAANDVEEAKRLAAGALGQKLSEFPLLFANSVFFGRRSSRQAPTRVNSGTVTLVDFGTGPIALTCAHVLTEYRRLLGSGESVFFQIGNLSLDPLAQLIVESPSMDLATIALSQKQAAIITRDGLSGAAVFQPTTWPSPPVKESDVVALGGFPGTWRERVTSDELDFHGFGIGATFVASVAEDHFACQFERDHWVWAYRIDGLQGLKELGGMSGGPAFIHRGLHYDFVGIIYELSPDYDVMFLRPAQLIRANGSIVGD
jgi:hypothetical protein